ncbi:PREDICTED: B3 domain-containing protein Os11g0197600-like [Nicotiana attenuata]|nr:PREDICTED: B3 domain-containing protein Os11g0197600-like [Nicotiana attenuata]
MEPRTYSYSSASFYVIVEPSVIDDGQLRMPDPFVQEHGDELLDTVKLIVPTDDFWCVSVKKSGKMIWLHDSWREFMEHHSIGRWYFLLFKYGKNSHFNVHIFDLNATEIDYQCKDHGNAKLGAISQSLSYGKEIICCVGDDKEDESSVEIVDPLETEQGPESSAKSSRAKRCKILPRSKFRHFYDTRSRTNKLHDEGRVLNKKNLNISGGSNLTKPLVGKLVQQNMDTPIYSAVVTGGVTNQDDAQVGSKNDILQLNESKHKIHLDQYIQIEPTADTRKSFTGQQWEKSVRRGRPHKRGRAKATETNRAINAAKMFKPENPYFMQILLEYNVVRNRILNIPADFVREYMPKTSELIELQDSAGNKWKARCIRRKMHLFLSEGWFKFVRDNGLLVGDACVFELIKDLQTDELMLKVHIFRSRVEENSTNLHTCSVSEPTLSIGRNCIQFNESKHTETSDAFGPVSSNRSNCKNDTKTSFTSQQQEKSIGRGRPYNPRKRGRPRAAEANMAINAAKMLMPANPYFVTTLGVYNVVRNYILYIPPEFVQDYMPKTSVPVELQDPDGNKWNTHCVRRKTMMFLSKGWVKFVRDNDLLVGDTCVFELINDIRADELMLKVHIFRATRKKTQQIDTLVAI